MRLKLIQKKCLLQWHQSLEYQFITALSLSDCFLMEAGSHFVRSIFVAGDILMNIDPQLLRNYCI